MIKNTVKWFKDVLTEFNDSPKDFIIHAVIVLAVVGAWGLIMGIMEEYR